MAWTQEKTTLLKKLLLERIAVEQDPQRIVKYQITRTWMQIIGSVLSDAQKQAILNAIIDDKNIMMSVDEAEWNAKVAARAALINQLATSKE